MERDKLLMVLMVLGIIILVSIPIFMHLKKKENYLKKFKKNNNETVIWLAEQFLLRQEIGRNMFSIQPSDLPMYDIETSENGGKLFNYQIHPVVEGYEFYRGYAFKLGNGIVMVFIGWSLPEKTHIPLVYTKGNFRPEVIENVVNNLFHKIAFNSCP